jgi:hypothetical protein
LEEGEEDLQEEYEVMEEVEVERDNPDEELNEEVTQELPGEV